MVVSLNYLYSGHGWHQHRTYAPFKVSEAQQKSLQLLEDKARYFVERGGEVPVIDWQSKSPGLSVNFTPEKKFRLLVQWHGL